MDKALRSFDIGALYAALDDKRNGLGLSWPTGGRLRPPGHLVRSIDGPSSHTTGARRWPDPTPPADTRGRNRWSSRDTRWRAPDRRPTTAARPRSANSGPGRASWP